MLIAAVAAFLVVAVLNWWSRWTDDDRLELFTKPLATVLVGVVAVLAGVEGDQPGAVVVLTVIALVFCLAGDVALMPQVDSFVAGLGAFLVGHLVFIAALAASGIDAPWLGLVALLVLGPVLAVVGRRIVAAARRDKPELAGPVVSYLIVISAMAVVAWTTRDPWPIVGATLFVTSDSILGWRMFVGEKRWMAVAIMVTYHGALLGLALACL